MGFQKFSSFLAFSILVLCQAGSLQAAPFRSVLDSSPDLATLSEKEMSLLLARMLQDYVQFKAKELEQETEGSSLDSAISKPCTNLSTCMLQIYRQDLNNFYPFFGISFRPEIPGRKRDAARGLQRDRGALEYHLSSLFLSDFLSRFPLNYMHMVLVALLMAKNAGDLRMEREKVELRSKQSITVQKKACNTATCVTHRLAGLLSRSGGVVKDQYVPTNVGSETFGRRRRDLQA